ncbi:MAG: hypothetical protein AABY22_20840 [Nanoarchaeota archaeon]
MVIVEGIGVSGEIIEPLKDKTFTVIKAPHYIEVSDLQNEGKKLRKLAMDVRLSDGRELEYKPNKTSLKMMTSIWGFEMDNWIGKRFEWQVANQNVMGKIEKVLFVIEKRFE